MLTSDGNERLKAIRRLRRSKGEADGRLLLEGPHLLAVALDAGLEPLEVYASPEFLDRGSPVLARLARPPVVVASRLLHRLADADSPRGLVATVRTPDWSLAAALATSQPTARPLLLGDRIQDPANVGGLARSVAAGAGGGLLLTAGCASPGHPRALRASAGSLLQIPVARDVEWRSLDLATAGRSWIALVTRGGSDLYTVDLPAGPILCLGSEGGGLATEIAERCDQQVSIPLAPGVESLNVNVAAALVLFELRRRATRSAG